MGIGQDCLKMEFSRVRIRCGVCGSSTVLHYDSSPYLLDKVSCGFFFHFTVYFARISEKSLCERAGMKLRHVISSYQFYLGYL